MTFIAWSLEFLTGVLRAISIIWSGNKKNNVDLIRVIIFIYLILNFIVIPSIYVFKNEVKKALDVAEECYDTLTTYFRPNRVDPIASNKAANEIPK